MTPEELAERMEKAAEKMERSVERAERIFLKKPAKRGKKENISRESIRRKIALKHGRK